MCVTLSAMLVCLSAGASVRKAHVSKRNAHVQTLEAPFCPADFSYKMEKSNWGKTNVFVCVCVCVRDCADVFVFVGDTKPVCTLPSPAICLCCTLGSVRMVWAPAVPPVTPALRLMPVQPPDTEAQPQLDCYHTTRIGSFSLSLSLHKKKKKTHTPSTPSVQVLP